MSELPTGPRPARRRNSSTVRALRITGVAVLILCVAAGILRLASRAGGPTSWGAAEIGEFGLFLLAGLACGGLFLGLSAMLRALRGLHASMVRMEQRQSELRTAIGTAEDTSPTAPVATPVVEDPDVTDSASNLDGQWHKLLPMLEDIRQSLLLSPEQRQEKRLRLAEEEIHNARLLVGSLTDKGDFAQAREVAEEAQRKYANDSRAEDLIEQVEEARGQHEAEDVTSFTRQVNDLISISAWEKARQLVQQLLERHPDSAEARQLLLRVERQHRLFEEEQRRRMNAEIQRWVTQRRWEEALAAARTFVERFPDCEDSEALWMEIPTLEANAEIEVRQRLEAEIMECARQGRYIEATELARRIIERYPDSPQARVLRSQLGRLEQLAQNPDAQPARVRHDE